MDESLSNKRSEVIERFINIEGIMDSIICQKYLKGLYMDFLFEVLYDEYFTIGLKIRILEKIIGKSHRPLLEKLRKLNRIRNYFAHLGKEIILGSSKKGLSFVPDPKDTNKAVDFDLLFREFKNDNSIVTLGLAEIFKKMGGILEK